MTKLIAKIAEKYAKATNNACIIVGIIHQPNKKIKNQKRVKKIQLIRVEFFLVYF